MTYDNFHRRQQKTVFSWINDSWQLTHALCFLYDGQNEIGSCTTSGQIVELRLLADGLGAEIGSSVAFELDNVPYAPIHDHCGSVVALLNTSGQTASAYRYSAFGEEIILNSSISNPWRFASKRTDEETGLVYFGRRYYDPAIGRWITADPEGCRDGINLYAYVHNKPLTLFDLYGLAARPAARYNAMARRVEKYKRECEKSVKNTLNSVKEYGANVGEASLRLCSDIGKQYLRENDLFTMEELGGYRSFGEVFSDVGTVGEFAMNAAGSAAIAKGITSYAINRTARHYAAKWVTCGLAGEVPYFSSQVAAKEGVEFAASQTSLVLKNPLSNHAAQRLSERGISYAMVQKAITKGSCYYDCKARTISYVLKNGFASKKTLQVSIDPTTGRVVTAMRKTKFNPNIKYNNQSRYVAIEE
jgi:RHS repeat-associated protein